MTMTQRLILATANAHKAGEMRELLAGCGWETAPAPPDAADVEETGETFAENARLKALAVAKATGFTALADDSGLAVDALGGRPGIRSKRWAGPEDADRIARLLEALDGVPPGERGAHFVCAACIAGPEGVLWEGVGTVEGHIADAPRGEGGFGYDPVFLLPDGRTMAELGPAEKNERSHRGRAMRAAAAWLAAQNG
jgi:XTP/dITP diphosphohydrolase